MFTDKQRESLIQERGEPKLSLEFDVWDNTQVSMWTHFDHNSNFEDVKAMLIAIRNHLNEFLNDEGMCPFHKQAALQTSAAGWSDEDMYNAHMAANEHYLDKVEALDDAENWLKQYKQSQNKS